MSKETAFYPRLKALTDEWMDLFGYWAPLTVTDMLEEYRAVRETAGLMDFTMLRKVDLDGPGALELVNAMGVRFAEAELYRLRGELLQTRGGAMAKGAEDAFRRALEVAAGQRARCLELRAAASLARLGQARGERKLAHPTLAEVCAWFTEGFDTSDLREARTLLAELS